MKKAQLFGIVVLLALLLWRWLAPPSQRIANPGLPKPVSATIPSHTPPSSTAKLPPAQIAAEMKRMKEALAKNGLYTDRAEMIRDEDSGELVWKKIDDTGFVIRSVLSYQLEPFAPRTLDALEHVLKHSKDPREKLAAATILYRYGRDAGRTYLLELINGSIENGQAASAAITLSLNRDKGALSDILFLFNKLESVPDGLLQAFGSWKDPSIVSALEQKQRENPKNWMLAEGLARLDASSGMPLLLERFSRERAVNYVSLGMEAAITPAIKSSDIFQAAAA